MTQPEWRPSFGPGVPLTSAHILARAVSFLIDFGGTVALTFGVVLASISAGFADYNGSSSGGNGALILLGIGSIFVIPAASIVVNVRLSRTRGHSVGQGVTRLRLVDVRTGGRASVGSIIGRMLILLVPGFSAVLVGSVIVRVALDGISMPGPSIVTVVAPVVLVAVLVPMLRGDGRGWQDRATNQVVVPAASRA